MPDQKIKQLILMLVLILTGHLALAQNRSVSMDEFLFAKGSLLQQMVYSDLYLDDTISSTSAPQQVKDFATDIEETVLEKALTYYQQLIDSFPQSKFVFRAMNNKAFIELALEDTDAAKKTFLQILNSTADDNEKGGIGSGIMGEPYANYKNRAATTLASIYLTDSNYKRALKYLDLTKKYPYQHFCGNEYAADDNYMCELYAKCYLGLHQEKKALAILLPHLVENGLADNSALVDLTYNTLIKQYSKKELRGMYEDAFKNYKVKKAKSKDGYDTYYIIFLGSKIVLPIWDFEFRKPEEQQTELKEKYEGSRFYTLLNK